MAEPAIDVPAAELDAHQDAGYGIFAGPDISIAVIRFTPHAARWVADENWHPKQRQRVLPDGSLELTLPYSSPRELLMDVQRYGADAEVVAPPELREEMRGMLAAAMGRYAEAAAPSWDVVSATNRMGCDMDGFAALTTSYKARHTLRCVRSERRTVTRSRCGKQVGGLGR